MKEMQKQTAAETKNARKQEMPALMQDEDKDWWLSKRCHIIPVIGLVNINADVWKEPSRCCYSSLDSEGEVIEAMIHEVQLLKCWLWRCSYMSIDLKSLSYYVEYCLRSSSYQGVVLGDPVTQVLP